MSLAWLENCSARWSLLALIVVGQSAALALHVGIVGPTRSHIGLQQVHIDLVGMAGVEGRTRFEIELGAGAAQRFNGMHDRRAHLLVDGRRGLVQPDRHAQALDALQARRGKCVAQASAVQLIRSDRGAQGQRQVLRAARQWTDHRQIALGQGLRHELVAALGNDVPGRLVAIHAAISRWVADAAADVTAEFQCR